MKHSIAHLVFALIFLLALSGRAQTAKVQIIHNCPDTIVDTVDVYLNDTLLIPGFSFQTATPYFDAPAGINFDLVITVAGKGDTTNPLLRKSFLLMTDSAYVVVVSGKTGNPGPVGFDLRAYRGQVISTNSGVSEISLKFIHGVYDAPMIDIYELLVSDGEIIPYLSFGQDSGYIDLDATDLDFQVRTQTGEVLGDFDANFIPFGDSAIVVLATGFLDTTAAAGNEPFGLIGVLANGNVITLPIKSIAPARLQVIHNCAAADAASVDVWLNAGPQPLIDNFAFRTASPFIDVPAGAFFDISVCLPNSVDTSGALFKQNFIFESNKIYIIIVSGIVGSGTYNPVVPFSLDVIPAARIIADIPSDVDIMVWHGSTDAPYIDIAETQVGAGTLVNNISYENYQGYISLPPQDYDFTIQDSSGTTNIAAYDANLTSFTGEAITILASGFLNPGNNNNGPDFGLWVAKAAGGNLIPLSNITGNKEINSAAEIKLFPNPVLERIKLSGVMGNATYTIFNVNGKVVRAGQYQKSFFQNIEVENLESGIYFIQFNTGSKQFMKRFTKL